MPFERRTFLKGLAGVSLLPELAPGEWLKTQAARRPSRQLIDLTGAWKMQVDPHDAGSKVEFFSPAFARESWVDVSIPATYNHCFPPMDGYRGVCWFTRSFKVPSDLADWPAYLCFQGVNYYTTVWLDGKKLIENKDAFLPFEVRLPAQSAPGSEARLTVRVDSVRAKGELPTFEGWFPDGGILREVWLEVRPRLHIEHVQTTAAVRDGGGELALRVRVFNESESPTRAQLYIRILDQQGKEVAALVSESSEIASRQSVNLQASRFLPRAAAWTPESPALYTADIALVGGSTETDRCEQRFGFRTIEIREGALRLNGKPVFLTGFNRHEDSPRTGQAMDLDQAHQDFQDMKQASCNFVRLCHYPHHPGELDLCDELGLLVMCEIPLNGWGMSGVAGSYGWDPAELPSIRTAAERQLTKMIARDINHPSVIFWSVCNEPVESHKEIVETNNGLIRLARSLDPTRLVTHVSMNWTDAGKTKAFDFDDVISVNQYSGHRRLDNPAFDFSEAAEWLRQKLDELRAVYPGKPVLVTEFGFPCLPGIDGPIGEDTQAEDFEAEFGALTHPRVCGATVWCFAKHPWPPGGYAKVLFNTSPYGFVSRDRTHKLKAFHLASRLFRERQAAKS
ncbi:MAG: glycoside hydrolase family 2 TIM barrel-domain containing protein [Acidobacteriota bacterium]